jgi:hypothetical protein
MLARGKMTVVEINVYQKKKEKKKKERKHSCKGAHDGHAGRCK